MKIHPRFLHAVWFVLLVVLLLMLPPHARADGPLRLVGVEFPDRIDGECDFTFRVEGDLASAKELVAETEMTKEVRGSKGLAKNVATIRETKASRHKAKSVDEKNGIITFHARFSSKARRMATCTLHYTVDGQPFQSNPVASPWFEITGKFDRTTIQ